MSIPNRCKHTNEIDHNTQITLGSASLPKPSIVLTELRGLLYNFQEEQTLKSNNVFGLVKMKKENECSVIMLGPSFDKGPEAGHFYFDSGARLSFGVTLQEKGGNITLLGYRFEYVAPENQFPSFIRFDFVNNCHETPFLEPMCHIHPGHEEIRLPSAPCTPEHALELILHAIDVRFR